MSANIKSHCDTIRVLDNGQYKVYHCLVHKIKYRLKSSDSGLIVCPFYRHKLKTEGEKENETNRT